MGLGFLKYLDEGLVDKLLRSPLSMGSVYKVRINSDLELNVSTRKDSNICWIVLNLVRVNGVKMERST
jgi:hypothetical protein